MQNVPWRLLLIGWMVFAHVPVALSGEYSHPSGFSFRYPDGWFAVDSAAVAKREEDSPPEVKKLLQKHKAALKQLAMMLVREDEDEFSPNLSLAIQNGNMSLDARSTKILTATISQGYASSGIKIENLQSSVQMVGANKALVMEFLSRIPGVTGQMHQKQVYIPGGGKFCLVTCTGTVESYEKCRSQFDEMLSSFRVPGSVTPPVTPTASSPVTPPASAPASSRASPGIDWSSPEALGRAVGEVLGYVIVFGALSFVVALVAQRFVNPPAPKKTRKNPRRSSDDLADD